MPDYKKVSILVVDDDLVSRELIVECLKIYEFEQIVAGDSVAMAYDCLAKNRFDIVLMDIGLPDGSGVEVLTSIRAKHSAISLPVVMISGDDETNNVVKCLELGANDFVAKPINIQVLMARIGTILTIKRLKQDVDVANERFALAAKGAHDALWDWFITTDEIYLSARWKQILGLEEGEVEPDFSTFVTRLHDDDMLGFKRALRAHLSGVTDYFEYECRMQNKSGAFRWLLMRGSALRFDNGKPYRMAGSISDITERKVLDPLTQTLNTSAFLDKLDMYIQARKSKQLTSFAVVLISIDRYKLISDSYGHHFCDHMAVEVTNRVTSVLQPQSTLARVANDKLAFVIENPAPINEVLLWLNEEVLKTMMVPLLAGEKKLHISFSASLVFDTHLYRYSHDILRDAEIALAGLIQQDGDRVRVFKPTQQVSLKDRVELEEAIHHAIEHDEFELYYQPKIDAYGTIQGAEALVRWRNQDNQFVSPADFIPIAEQSGLIIGLGKLLFRQLCCFLAKCNDAGLTIQIAFNLSGKQFLDPRLCDFMFSTMDEWNISSQHIELEITESTILHDVESAVLILKEFQDRGITISIDDFGTGYSSLAYLKRLPIEKLKIDKSFVDDLPHSKDDVAIATAIINMAHALNLKVVAEGVENSDQFTFLTQLGVEMYQGFLFYKPMPEAAFLSVLDEQSKGNINEAGT
ncbi:EAL domain-containing protein [Pseudoalteromonas piscicida]|uniref:two-component system response regulator n=1 Tax=Pseudoalteromonas piscicida TaxID=43662 RepID=UPI0005F9FFFF|nr:EAL domain-containing protein [Pseudoalteromonas piscicida]KJY96928.1 hypothetical protein TW73_15965 [Pseudoalteromonas piscicida]